MFPPHLFPDYTEQYNHELNRSGLVNTFDPPPAALEFRQRAGEQSREVRATLGARDGEAADPIKGG